MLIDVGLAGVQLTWRFGRTDAETRWLDSRPWSNRGGVLTLRVGGPAGGDAVGASVLDRVRQIEGSRFARDVFATSTELDLPMSDALAQIRRWLEVGEPRSAAERLASTAAALREVERVWVVQAQKLHEMPTRFPDELRNVLEALQKLDPRARAAVVLLDNVARKSEAIDLRRGMPIAGIGVGMPVALWDWYVHHRLAWESGGDIDRAQRWQDALSSVRRGDDDGIEVRLNEAADVALNELPSRTREVLLACAGRPIDVGGVARWLEEDALEPLAWDPSGVLEPLPWVARALLRRTGYSSPARGALRAALVCAPLRDLVVARCLAWEGQVRGARVPAGQPSERTRSIFAQFERGSGVERSGYPRGSPAVPRSAWEFASLGEFIAALPPTRTTATMHEVRRLRNAMVHGHHVSWATLVQVDALETALRQSR